MKIIPNLNAPLEITLPYCIVGTTERAEQIHMSIGVMHTVLKLWRFSHLIKLRSFGYFKFQ